MILKVTDSFDNGCIEGFPYTEQRRIENLSALKPPVYVSKFSESKIEKIREALSRCGIVNEHAVQELLKIMEDH